MGYSATLDDSAKELAREIAASLPPGETVSCEIRNLSSLPSDEVSRIGQSLKAELQGRGVGLAENRGAAASVIVTLSENWKEFVWTGEIRQGDALHAVFLAVSRAGENQALANAMHLTVSGEKFWEGRERILDAAEVSSGSGQSWLVLLLQSALVIQDLQTGLSSKVDIASAQATSRDPWGQIGSGPTGTEIWFAISPQVCRVDLETRSLVECLPTGAAAAGTKTWRFPFLPDLAPAGPPLPGKGTELVIAPVCGGTNQFLATSARDYTQTDSLQVFQTEANGPVAMSGELDFSGPIVALHTALDAPRAIVRNLTTGKYEAYRLDISCRQ